MPNTRQFCFHEFRLDLHDERLWRRGENVPLGHKAFGVLVRLLSEPGQLVTKYELVASAWPDTAVGDAVLTTAMRELRLALGDDARSPRFIETVHGRGYRFIAPVHAANTSTPLPLVSDVLVGREQELAQLHALHEVAQQGTRRIALIAGEAGIGKTTLVDAFVAGVVEEGRTVVGHGQCVEQYGAGEAYLPILEALGRMGRDPNIALREILREQAPDWLAHLPTLAGDTKPPIGPVTPARMLRELADALETLAAREPLILVLEDLHWSDIATLEWLAYAARRRDPARLLICATYRPLETLLHNDALRRLTRELARLPQCTELVLDYLPTGAVKAYVAQRMGNISGLSEMAEVVLRRTGGHPLFMSAIIDELLRTANSHTTDTTLIRKVVPPGIRQFTEYRLEQLNREDREVLEAACVAGDPFPVATLASSLGLPEEMIESCCATWERCGQFVFAIEPVAWPDGTLTQRYRFRHALYQEVLYARISPERRARLHSATGERLEKAYASQEAMIAAELALHFEQGRQADRAVSYLLQAARNALERSGYAEGQTHLDRGEKLLPLLAPGAQRSRRELELLLLLGRVLAATRGWAVQEVESVFDRARLVAGELQDTQALLRALWGLIGVTFVGADFRKAQTFGREVLELATTLRDPVYGVLGHMEIGGTALHLGEPAAISMRHFEEAYGLYHVEQHSRHIANFGVDMGVFSRSWATHCWWHKGYLRRACTKSDEALAIARELSHPLTLAVALGYAAMLQQFRRDSPQIDALAEATISVCREHGFPYYLAWAEVLQGWSLTVRGNYVDGIGGMRRGIELLEAKAGARLPYYRALLAEGCLWAGDFDAGLEAVAQAFRDAGKTGECWWDSELHRLHGELIQMQPNGDGHGAEECFERAMSTARAQEAKSLELRAAVSLARLWHKQGRGGDAQTVIQRTYNLFSDGLDDPDLRDARTLLDELAADVHHATQKTGAHHSS
jgi:DNA-binding winged helix-turn-helix (wHTH) protein/predicted ATPase